MTILLINPPAFRENKPTIPPLGLAYIAAVLRLQGFEVNIIDYDLERERLPHLENVLDRHRPSIVGISALTLQLENAFDLAARIKARLPGTRTVIGGPHPSSLPELTLKDSGRSIDIAVVGEGEYTMVDIAKGMELEEIRGIAFSRDTELVKTPPRPPIADLDELPLPARDLLPIEKYKGWGPLEVLPTTHLIASRGCPYECVFCSEKSVFGKTHRRRSPGKIVDEIESLIQTYGMREVAFYDDLFTLSKKQVLSICREMIRRRIKIRWKTLSRVDTVDMEMLQGMKAAGCWLISYGFESGSQDILNNIRKRQTVEQCVQAADMTRRAGIRFFGFFMLGNIGETRETIRETIRFARLLNPDYFQFTVVRPDPGSYLFNQHRDSLLKPGLSWNDYYAFPKKATAMPIVGTDLPADRIQYYRKLAYMLMSRKRAWVGMLQSILHLDPRLFLKSIEIILKPDPGRI